MPTMQPVQAMTHPGACSFSVAFRNHYKFTGKERDSDSWGGQSVFDVYTKSEGIALDGTKYKDW